MRALSIANILDKVYEYIPFGEKFLEAFGKRQRIGIWIVYGKSGMGKTRFTFDLAREFERIGYSVLYVSLEMGVEADFNSEIQSAGFQRGNKIKVFAEISYQELDEYLSKQRSPNVIIIDSLQYFIKDYGIKASDIIRLRKKYRSKVFVYISHVEGKEVEGADAYLVKRDSFVRIQVEGFRAMYKGRGRGGEKGYYTIWEEGAEKYWLESGNNQNQ